jgi:hypothetical protein
MELKERLRFCNFLVLFALCIIAAVLVLFSEHAQLATLYIIGFHAGNIPVAQDPSRV